MDDLYREEILEESRSPRNFSSEKVFGITVKNPACGDDLSLSLEIGDDGLIKQVLFSGNMCALAKASASFLTEYSKGKSIEHIISLKEEDFWGIVHSPRNLMRKNCIFLIKEGYNLYARTKTDYNTKR
jgi:NifU-like protein involved in Fe-S cluster formation